MHEMKWAYKLHKAFPFDRIWSYQTSAGMILKDGWQRETLSTVDTCTRIIYSEEIILSVKHFCHPLPLLQYFASTIPTAPMCRLHKSPWWIIPQHWCHHSSITLYLCCSYWHAQCILLQSHPCCRLRDKRNKRVFQVHVFHFLLLWPMFSTSSHLDPISKHCLFQGTFHQNRHCNSEYQSHSIATFFQAHSSTPFAFSPLSSFQHSRPESDILAHDIIQ